MSAIRRNDDSYQNELNSIIDAIYETRGVLILVVRYLLNGLREDRLQDSRVGRPELGGDGDMEVDNESGTSSSGEINESITPDLMDSGSTSSSSEVASVQDQISPSKPLTLLDIYDATQSPGCKRKRSITHLGSISIASILPSQLLQSTLVQEGGIVKDLTRPVVTRKKIGLGSLLKGMRVRDVVGSDLREDVDLDEDSDSEDDDDLIILMK